MNRSWMAPALVLNPTTQFTSKYYPGALSINSRSLLLPLFAFSNCDIEAKKTKLAFELIS